MPESDNAFHDLIRRVRAGNEEAATEIVQRYEPAIRRAVRIRLVDPAFGASSIPWTSPNRFLPVSLSAPRRGSMTWISRST